MSVRKLMSVFTAVTFAGAALAVPVAAAPVADTLVITTEDAGEAGQEYPFSYPSYYLLASDTDTIAPLRADLPAGTTLDLVEGPELAALRADGWSISAADSTLTVTAACDSEGKYRLPVIVTYPDQSTLATSVAVDVDYLVDPLTSSLVPGGIGCQLSKAFDQALLSSGVTLS